MMDTHDDGEGDYKEWREYDFRPQQHAFGKPLSRGVTRSYVSLKQLSREAAAAFTDELQAKQLENAQKWWSEQQQKVDLNQKQNRKYLNPYSRLNTQTITGNI